MKNCIFCKISNKEIPSNIVYEDNIVCVFLDVRPSTPGHMLIVPKKHILNMYEMDESTLLHINKIALKMSELLKSKLGNDGLTLLQNNGIAQEVKHYHLHLIPKYSKKVNLSINEVFNKLSN